LERQTSIRASTVVALSVSTAPPSRSASFAESVRLAKTVATTRRQHPPLAALGALMTNGPIQAHFFSSLSEAEAFLVAQGIKPTGVAD